MTLGVAFVALELAAIKEPAYWLAVGFAAIGALYAQRQRRLGARGDFQGNHQTCQADGEPHECGSDRQQTDDDDSDQAREQTDQD